jgi:ATP-binding cassette subfamily B protein
MAVILVYGGYRITQGTLTLGILVAFNVYLARLTRPLTMLGNMTRIYQDAVAGGRRVFEVIDATPDIKDKPGAVNLGKIEGRVSLEGVSFSYHDGSPSLEGVSFAVEPGETVVLLGGTGSGKSTIVNLIPRFYDPTAGSVKVDGHDLRDVSIRSLRKVIGIVPQETFLFSTTIKENIAYGRPGASVDEIREAAKLAEADGFISAMPQGYDTVVGERGVTLSGGEKQRVAIARALLMDPRILILDDSTSSVDTETEYQIQRALDALLENRTTFIITQRLSMIRKGDKIVVLDQGKIAEQGTHKELLAQDGVYKKIYEAQSGVSFAPGEGG